MADKLITFAKYHGLGNDFILVNATDSKRHMPAHVIRQLCQRRFGIGADGYIELHKSSICEFRLDYYIPDGSPDSLCGNGARCAVAYAKKCGLFVGNSVVCEAFGGPHIATIDPISQMVTVELCDVTYIKQYDDDNFFVDTGSPHHVRYVTDLHDCAVISEGRALRHGIYGTEGANINFVQTAGDDKLNIRTYERGLEDETLACGTGSAAAAIVTHFKDVQFDGSKPNRVELVSQLVRTVVKSEGDIRNGEELTSQPVRTVVKCEGGEAVVSFNRTNSCSFSNVTLTGPVCHVYDGTWYC